MKWPNLKFLHDFFVDEDPKTATAIHFMDEDGKHAVEIPAWLWSRLVEQIQKRKGK